MLVLSRQKNEAIMIGDDIEITIVDIRGDKIRLGISAPNHVPVHRKEIYLAIKEENERAAAMESNLIDSAANLLDTLQLPAPKTDEPQNKKDKQDKNKTK